MSGFNIAKMLAKNRKSILTGITCGGVIITALAAHEDTCRANDISDEDFKSTWYHYIPTALMSAATIATAVTNHKLSSSQIASIVGGAGTSSKLLYEYKNKVREIAGYDTYEEVQRSIARDNQDGVIRVTAPTLEFANFVRVEEDEGINSNILFYDEFSGTWFRTSFAALRSAFYHYNRDFALAGHMEINTYYEFLGLEPIEQYNGYGHGFQMIESEIVWVDYYLTKDVREDGEPYYIVSFDYPPYILTDDD